LVVLLFVLFFRCDKNAKHYSMCAIIGADDEVAS
jgi:hypothetical protein